MGCPMIWRVVGLVRLCATVLRWEFVVQLMKHVSTRPMLVKVCWVRLLTYTVYSGRRAVGRDFYSGRFAPVRDFLRQVPFP